MGGTSSEVIFFLRLQELSALYGRYPCDSSILSCGIELSALYGRYRNPRRKHGNKTELSALYGRYDFSSINFPDRI